MSASIHSKLDRVRKPRVHITYDVETEGAAIVRELPFVMGVMGDFSGDPTAPLQSMTDRKFVQIDRDNFNDVMVRSAPRVAFRVPDKISGQEDQLLNVELNFRNMKDFDPARVAEQVPVLNELLTMRRKLTELLSKMEGNDKLEELLGDILANTDKAKELARTMGIAPADAATETPTPEKPQ